MEEKKVPSS